MSIILPDLTSVISGIVTLGANVDDQLFLPKIHTVLYQMKQHHRMLAGLWFSITGSVCYSREIENALRDRKFYAHLGACPLSSFTAQAVSGLR